MDVDAYRDCVLCPRQCHVDRVSGQTGVCGETASCRLASASPHFGEEPAISGSQGSGTMFFTGCSCGCFFCQNWQISREGVGDGLSIEELVDRARALVRQGVHNLNLVTPEHFWPHIRELVNRLRGDGIDVPVVWNSSGYIIPDLVPEYAEFVDIFMPDFKFSDPDLAERCMRDRRYPDLSLKSICRMIDAVGVLRPWSDDRVVPARKGVLIRHLVLPGEVENSCGVLRRLHDRLGPAVALSVMSQYHPTPACRQRGSLTRRVTSAEYDEVCALVEDLGFETCYIQPGRGDSAFLPDFHEEEPFEGNRKTNRRC